MATTQTPRILLRRLREEDAAPIQELCDDPQVSYYLTTAVAYPYTLAHAQTFMRLVTTAPPSLPQFAICSPPDTIVGAIGLKLPKPEGGPTTAAQMTSDPSTATILEVGYWLGRKHWGKGLVPAALEALCPYAFEKLPNLRSIEGLLYEPNKRSAGALRKSGFKYVETREKAETDRRGDVVDLVVYAISREDCLARSKEGKAEAIIDES